MNNEQEKDFLKKLKEGKELVFKARGDSMLPFYSDGTCFFMKKVSIDDLRIGDLLLFKRDEKFILHRLIKLPKTGKHQFVTKGDRLRCADSAWMADELLAKAVAVIKNGDVLDLSIGYKRAESYLIAFISPILGKLLAFVKK